MRWPNFTASPFTIVCKKLSIASTKVEGSSDNNVSPPTSVIQGVSEKANGNGSGGHTYEWIKSGSTGHKWSVSKEFLSHHEELNSKKFCPKYSSNNANGSGRSGGQVGPANGFHSLEEEVLIADLFVAAQYLL